MARILVDPAPLLQIIKEHEGGLVDDPDDPGGITNHGMSLREAQRVGDSDGNGRLDFDIDGDGDVDRYDIIALPLEVAQQHFIRHYLVKPRLDELPMEIVPFMFDAAIHSGPSVATRHLQRVINLAEFGPIREDGICGDTTIRKAHLAQDGMGSFLVNALVEERLAFFQRLVQANPAYRKYVVSRNGGRGGWVKRVERFRVPV